MALTKEQVQENYRRARILAFLSGFSVCLTFVVGALAAQSTGERDMVMVWAWALIAIIIGMVGWPLWGSAREVLKEVG